MYIDFPDGIHFHINSNILISSHIFWARNSLTVKTTIQIMREHTGVGDVVGMEIGDFKVIGSLRLGKLFARNAFYFAKRAVGKKDFIAML